MTRLQGARTQRQGAMQRAWDGGQAGRGRRQLLVRSGMESGMDRGYREGGEALAGLAGTAACGGLHVCNGTQRCYLLPACKMGQLGVRGATAHPGPAGSIQATFFSFANPISLEVLLQPGGFSIDPIWNNPKQLPSAPGGSGREPASHPTSNRNPHYLPTREQNCPCNEVGWSQGRQE